MPVFEYKARDRSGKLISATMEAASQRDVAVALREKGYFITDIRTPKGGLNATPVCPWCSRWRSCSCRPRSRA